MLGRRAKQRAVDHFGDAAIALGIQVHAVDRERGLTGRVELKARRVEIDERHALRLGDLAHGPGVQREPLIVLFAVRQIGVAQVFVRDRREDDDARRGLAVVALGQRLRDPVAQLLLERLEAGLSRIRFVVAEEGEHHVGLRVGVLEPVFLVAADRRRIAAQPLVRRAEILGTQPRPDLIAAEAQVAHRQLVLRKPRLQHGLEPAVVLKPLRQRVADDGDVLAAGCSVKIGFCP